MCGRYAFYLPPGDLKKLFNLENLINFPPRYNCAPMQDLPIIIHNRMGFGRWGFRPPRAEEDGPAMAAKMINARSETVHEKPAFQQAWEKGRRCIVPANGFYEWKNTGAGKQPYFVKMKDDGVMGFAGIWAKNGTQVSFSILTNPARPDIEDIHHRMPVMVRPDQARNWFEGGYEAALKIIQAAPEGALEFYPVDPDVGNVANDRADLTEKSDFKTSLF